MHKIVYQESPVVTNDGQSITQEEQLESEEFIIPSRQSALPRQKDIMKKKPSVIVLFLLIAALASGVGTGYGVYSMTGSKGPSEEMGTAQLQVGSPTAEIKVGEAYGSPNEEIFKDSAEGVIQAGGLDGEGSHHLVRPGGKSQTVYLTSSVVDLKKFEGAKVKLWGETFSAQKAGWLMDVGRVKVLELNAALPEE